MWDCFSVEYLRPGPLEIVGHQSTAETEEHERLQVKLRLNGKERTAVGTGNGPIASFVDALAGLGIEIRVLDYDEHAVGAGADARPRATSRPQSATECCGASASTRASSPPPCEQSPAP